ncbi:hypothetical protein EPN44_01210 [bacterium]|nr:MAG: hypothetical protein EPN44_01210 [bacterium]
MAVCIVVADAVARGLHLPRGYWIPLTVAIVLKPEFASTFARGLARLGGTVLGLIIATGMILAVTDDRLALIALIGMLTWVIRSYGRTNYTLVVVAVTALVVLLFSLAGERAETTIVERGVYTLAGGLLALAAYAAWPTWERSQAPGLLADMLEAYRRYFAAVMAGYLDSPAKAAILQRRRTEARLGRSNAEASIERMLGEPARSDAVINDLFGLLASSHRFVYSGIVLEAHLQGAASGVSWPELRRFANDVDGAVAQLAAAVRSGSAPALPIPNLRADYGALQASLAEEPAARQQARTAEQAHTRAFIVAEADRVVNSVDTMAHVLARGAAPV